MGKGFHKRTCPMFNKFMFFYQAIKGKILNAGFSVVRQLIIMRHGGFPF